MPFNNPFGKLAELKDKLPEGKAATPATAPQKTKEAPRRAVIAYERKGHGGKECTRITHFCVSADEAVVLCKKLKEKLGVGGFSEGSDIVLQGDQRDRLRSMLPSFGVQRLTVA